MAGRFSIEAVFKAVDKITGPVNKMMNRVSKLTRGMKRGFIGFGKTVDKLGRGLKKIGIAAVASLLIVGGAAADVIKTGVDFEQTLVNASAKFPEGIRRGSEAFKQLEQVARKTGATTEFTATQSAEALNFMAMAGFNAKQAIAALPSVVDLATTAQIDLALASDIATDTLGAFGLATKDPIQLTKNLSRVVDALAKTSVTANTTIEKMMETVEKGGPIAVAAGQSLETYLAFTGSLANAGIKASVAGTTLKNTFVRLTSAGGEAGRALKRMKVEVADSDGKIRDIVDIFGDLEKALPAEGDLARMQLLNKIFGRIPLAGVNVLLKEGSSNLREYRREILAATGANKEMADVMRDTTQGSINRMTSAFEGLKISIFSTQNVAIRGIIDQLAAYIGMVDTVVQKNEELVNQFVGGFIETGLGVAQIILSLTIIFLTLKTAIIAINIAIGIWKGLMLATQGVLLAFAVATKIAAAAVFLFNAAMSFGILGIIFMVIVAVIGAIVLLTLNWKKITKVVSNFFKLMWKWIGVILTPFFKLIDGILLLKKGLSGFFEDEEKKIKLKPELEKDPGFKGIGVLADGGEEETTERPQLITPDERTAKSIEERRETASATVLIADETGRAKIADNDNAFLLNLNLANSGSFGD